MDLGGTALSASVNVDGEGSPTGLSLDDAISEMISRNIELHAFSKEIPQAEADLLTAGLRTNPLLFADAQFIPYGAMNADKRPIGPTQYDIALIVPLDVSHKRKSRMRVAAAARSVVQAQYQDAVRRQIANVGHAFVDLQVAYLAKNSLLATRDRHDRLIRELKSKSNQGVDKAEDLKILSMKWLAAMDEANDSLDDSREALALLLNRPPEDSNELSPRGQIRAEIPVIPPLEELVRIALNYRPDLAAARLGIVRADAEIRLAKANRVDDVILFLDPLSYQDNRPYHRPSGRSWDIGVTMPLPILNRNQGNIAKARVNADQTRLEYAALERRIVSEVRLATREVRSSRDILDKIERTIRPDSLQSIRRAESEFYDGALSSKDYLSKLEDEEESARQHRDALVRHRRAMLDLNTAAGVRLLP